MVSELVDRAVELEQPAYGLTDHGVLFGAPDLFAACKDKPIKGIIGMEAYEAVPHTFDIERDNDVFKVKWADLNGRDRYYHLTIWVLNEQGWANICALHSRAWTADYLPTQRGKPLVDRTSLEKHNEGLMIGLGCIASRTNVTLGRNGEDAAYEAAKWYKEVFGDRVVMEVMGNLPDQQALIRGQRKIAGRLGIPVVSTNDVHYRDQIDGRENGPHHVLVQARAFKKADTEVATDKSDDGFGQWYGSDEFYVKSAQQMLDTGFQEEEIEQTLIIADRVDFDFDKLQKPKPPIAAVPNPGENELFDLYVAQAGT